MQIVVSNVQVRHGLFMLVPEIMQVLGGMVEELEEARKRLVVEVNKPPRGKRYIGRSTKASGCILGERLCTIYFSTCYTHCQ